MSATCATRQIDVPLPGREYAILIGAGLLAGDGAPALRPYVGGRHCVVVSDSHVGPLYLEPATDTLQRAGAAKVTNVVFPAGEASKTLETMAGLYGRCVELGVDRQSVVVALGGGVTGDLAGFLAATYMRGVALVQVPTSLLAQVDSSVGGKTGVDLPEGKNLVGAFKQPCHVLVDLDTLRTLPPRELRGGLAEVVKYGAALDAELFGYLETHAEGLLGLAPEVCIHVVGRCCELKAEVVVEDELDADGARAVLNYGHTFGHALETLGGYTRLIHGEAIAIGMMMAADLAAAREPDLRPLVQRQQDLWERLGLPTRAAGFAPAEVLDAMRSDKKTVGGRLRLVLPVRLGACRLVADVAEQAVLAAIEGRCDR